MLNFQHPNFIKTRYKIIAISPKISWIYKWQWEIMMKISILNRTVQKT